MCSLHKHLGEGSESLIMWESFPLVWSPITLYSYLNSLKG